MSLFDRLFESDEELRRLERKVKSGNASAADVAAHERLKNRAGAMPFPRKQKRSTANGPDVAHGAIKGHDNAQERASKLSSAHELARSLTRVDPAEAAQRATGWRKKMAEKMAKMSKGDRENYKDRLSFITDRARARKHELRHRGSAHFYRADDADDSWRRDMHIDKAKHWSNAAKTARLGSFMIKRNPLTSTATRKKLNQNIQTHGDRGIG